eukprot:scaffold22600_cov195-Cylindrotheca_fusiformis.AAC.3
MIAEDEGGQGNSKQWTAEAGQLVLKKGESRVLRRCVLCSMPSNAPSSSICRILAKLRIARLVVYYRQMTQAFNRRDCSSSVADNGIASPLERVCIHGLRT